MANVAVDVGVACNIESNSSFNSVSSQFHPFNQYQQSAISIADTQSSSLSPYSYCPASSIHPSASQFDLNDTTHNRITPSMPVLVRGAFARAIYERMLREEQLKSFDRNKWYKCDMNLIPEDLREKHAESHCDSETQEFLDACYEKSDWYFTHLFHSFAKAFLSLFMSSTSANGLLGRGSMFVFSDKQFTSLMGDSLMLDVKNGDKSSGRSLLDLGAGDGKVTEVMARYFDTIHTTEISPVMRKLLTKRGYSVIDVETWHDELNNGMKYNLISCLNLLDRCDKPITMLHQMKAKLKPNVGRILLALVLPFSQYVEVNGKEGGGGGSGHSAAETLPIEGNSFESQLVSLRNHLLTPNGLEIIKWTKLPYLCEGDLDLTFYWLYDVVLLLKPID